MIVTAKNNKLGVVTYVVLRGLTDFSWNSSFHLQEAMTEVYSKILVNFYQNMWHYIPEVNNLHVH